MSESAPASRLLGRKPPPPRGAPRLLSAVCVALLVHLGVGELWSTPAQDAPPLRPSLRWQMAAARAVRPAVTLRAPPPLEPPTPLEAPQARPRAEWAVPWFEEFGPETSERLAESATASVEQAASVERAARVEPSPGPELPTAVTAELATAAPPAPIGAPDPAITEAAHEVAARDPAAQAATAAGTSHEPRPLASARPPSYPPLALRHGWQGPVELLVQVGADGHPEGASLRLSSGVPLLDRTAREAVLAWRFEPARADGEPVPGEALVRLRFRLIDAEVRAEPPLAARAGRRVERHEPQPSS